MAAMKHMINLEKLVISNNTARCVHNFLNKGASGSSPILSLAIISRGIHLTTCLEKRQSPRTVGIPAWKKAAIDRKQFVAKLRKPKSEETIKAEIRLQQKDEEFSLFTTSRIRNIPKEKEFASRVHSEVFLSKDGSTVICYHPTPKYPKEKTRPAWERPTWYGDRFVVEKYNEDLTEDQIEEAKQLREIDSKIWTASALGHMFKVKPSVVSEKLPLTAEQSFEKEIEKKLLYEWGKPRKLDYKKYQNQPYHNFATGPWITEGDVKVELLPLCSASSPLLKHPEQLKTEHVHIFKRKLFNKEILEYIQKTRGETAVNEFRQKMDI